MNEQALARAHLSRADVLAVAVCAVAVSLAAATIALDVSNARAGAPDTWFERGWLAALTGLAQVLPGALLLRKLPRHPVAWVLTGSGLFWIADAFAAGWATRAVYVSTDLPGASAAAWFYDRFGAALMLGLPLLLLIFPDGKLPHERGWRIASILSLSLTALLPLALTTVPADVMMRFRDEPLPPEIASLELDPFAIHLPYGLWQVLLIIAYAGIWTSLIVPFAVTVHRYRKAEGQRRLQMRWLVWAALADVIVLLFAIVWQSGLLLALAVALTSMAIVVAVTKHRLYDIDRLLVFTLGYGFLGLCVVLVDIAVFALAGTVLGERDAALAAIAIVAVIYAPLRHRLWGVLRRLMHGSREDPYGTVSTLAERLESAADPDQQLAAVARSVAEAFRLPYVRVELARPSGETVYVEYGSAGAPLVSLPISYRGESVGRLVFSRTGRGELSQRDQRLLGDLVRQAATATRAGELTEALQRIRAQLVVAREEERRRLRRDLHDSLGPNLAAVTLRIETARNLAASSPAESDRLLQRATDEVAAALADVRRLVNDLRPPALDELGLLGAVEALAQRFTGTDRLDVSVAGDPALSALPAAVEVAAYRIVSEALTNVHRHAGASRCRITLRVDGTDEMAVDISVLDDGTGISPERIAGVGLLSLRERAAELGGSCEVTCPQGGGTLVRARIPFAALEVGSELARA